VISLGVQPGPQEWTLHPRRGGAKPRHVAVDGVVHTTSPTLAAQLACSGLGLLRVVEWVIRDELRRGDLVEVLPEWSSDDPTDGGVPVYVIYAQTASATPPLKSRVFVDLVKDVVLREGIARTRR